jgi:hypothetical protein
VGYEWDHRQHSKQVYCVVYEWDHGLLNLNCAALITAVTKLGFSMEQLIPLTSKNSPLTNSIC